MRSVKKTALVFVLLLAGCLSSTKKTDIKFADYLKTLDNVPLPFEHACTGKTLPKLSSHFDSLGFEKYKDRDCARPLGILFLNSFNVITVDLSNADQCVAPVLVSFDNTGNKIDSLSLYQNAYQDTASAIMPYFRIDKNKRIVIIDTLKKWNNNTPSAISSITIDSTIYNISKNGKFVIETPKK